MPHRILSARVALLLVALTVVACSPEQPDASADAPRWNILFVFADDWGRYAGAYADIDARPGINAILHTPNIDRVAREGTVFRHAFASAPSCTPSRSALMSGRHFFNTGHGAILRTAVWDGSVPSYPFALREAGYRIGKSYKIWRPGHPADAPFGGQDYAYQEFSERNAKFSRYVSGRMKEGIGLAEASAEVLDGVRRNYAPDRWPMGSPEGVDGGPPFADFDGGPTKTWLIEHAQDTAWKGFFHRELMHRPAEELYDVNEDPDQIVNLAGDPAYESIRETLSTRLFEALEAAGDLRLQGDGLHFERPPFTDPVTTR